MNLQTCVHPTGRFRYGIHKPAFNVHNLRQTDREDLLGYDENHNAIYNQINFPQGTVNVREAGIVFEITNAFPFRGATYIAKSWADRKAKDRTQIRLKSPPEMSLGRFLSHLAKDNNDPAATFDTILEALPDAIKLTTAVSSTDPDDLIRLAKYCCRFVFDAANNPIGLLYSTRSDGIKVPLIQDHDLFEAIANNVYLPDTYKRAMVLKPGVQGTSEIVGEYQDTGAQTHVYEYLRKNSYIPWGHYAANMADDAIRYRCEDLTLNDIIGMRHLYYQRTYVRMAEDVGCLETKHQGGLDREQIEKLRLKTVQHLFDSQTSDQIQFNRTLWGWNFGFDYAPTRYRLHASHQQVHQQYALLPKYASPADTNELANDSMASFGFGDLVEHFVRTYNKQTHTSFFNCYINAIRNNRRMDGNSEGPSDLIIFEDPHVILFVPKAQTSQWELQLMTKEPVGNIIEADTAARSAIDRAIFYAVRALGALGARMITGIESAKRFDAPQLDQRLMYCFLPRLPESPGAFSETQLRWINGHYPEDFAAVCRNHLPIINRKDG